MDLSFLMNTKVVGTAVFFFGIAWRIMQKYQDIAAWLVIRVEKDSADGLTNEEKKQIALDCLNEKVKPLLPFWWRFVLMILPTEKIIDVLIDKICKQSSKLK